MPQRSSSAATPGAPESATRPDHDAIIIGAGVCGIYQLHRLRSAGFDAVVIEAGSELGGTWFWNRYPGARFDSESYTYGFSFSKEILQEWDWRERFSSQPENLRYLQFVADRLGLRPHMRFGITITQMSFDEERNWWTLRTADGSTMTARFVVMAIGLLAAPTKPQYDGMESFRGESFHTYDWPQNADLHGKRVAVIGTGATAIQLIPEIAPTVESLTVFQRRPNWTAPLHNSLISAEEMADIKSRYDEIFDLCSRTPGGFIHGPDRRPFFEVSRADRLAMWEELYGQPGFGIWLANFRDIFTDDAANTEFSEFIADKIRSRVNDPEIAEKLIPKDHGFGIQRVPLETNYLEAYNRDNVELVSLHDCPITHLTATGIATTDRERDFDVIIYATGFDAITGSYDRIDVRGRDGQSLRDVWRDGPLTQFGFLVPGFPNMLMPNGPQSASATTNFPRGIELGVDWCTELMLFMRENGHSIADATPEAAEEWAAEVKMLYEMMLMRNAQGWFTGYNSNVPGHEAGRIRYLIYNGGTPKFRKVVTANAEAGYPGTQFD